MAVDRMDSATRMVRLLDAVEGAQERLSDAADAVARFRAGEIPRLEAGMAVADADERAELALEATRKELRRDAA